MVIITSIDSVLGELARLDGDPSLPPVLSFTIKKLQLEFMFLKMFFCCFTKWDDAAKDELLGPLVADIGAQLRKAGQGLYAAGLIAIHRGQTEKWEIVALNLLGRVQNLKPKIADICLDLLDRSFECNFSSSYEILDFISTILENLKHLEPMEMEIKAFEEILWFLRGFVDFAGTRAITYEKLEDFWNHVQYCANKAAFVLFLFWVSEVRGPKIDSVLSDLLQKIEPFTPETVEMYIGILKASKFSWSDTSLIGEVVASFVDRLLKNLQVSMMDYIAVLGEGLTFLIMFLMDPPELSETDGKLIWTKVDAVVSDIASFICSSSVDQTSEQHNKFPRELFQRIDKVKAEIKELYLQISDSSFSDFPKTNGLGFINFLSGKIDGMLKCDADANAFVKYQFATIQEELVSLQGFLKQQNRHNQLEQIWMQIIKVAYRAEHVIDTSLIMDAPIWHRMIQLSDVIERMKLIKLDFKKMESKLLNIPVLCDEMKSRIDLPKEAKISRTDVVGFDDDADKIIGQLINGSSRLEIVSIVGMPGIGKTTLAMKVFDSAHIRLHFDACAWCHVSQAYNYRESLLNILNSYTLHVKLPSELDDEQLAVLLYRHLIGRRFFIVLDDIWDIKAWHELSRSFPNNGNGSRILLTSQIVNVALQANPNVDPYFLHPLSDEESWKLLNVKLFPNGVCPPELLEVGRQIAKNCKGLPLTVALIAGVLERKEKDLHFWQQIARSPSSYIDSEGCMGILERRYNHLPHALRSCFLYFATFSKETVIKVKRLCRLWISEGFIPKSDGKSLEDVANDYLMDLISKNLVIVDSRCFNERIKECHVHDLLHSLCVAKSEEEGFLQLVNTSGVQSKGINYKQYRLCIHSEWRPFVNSEPTGQNVRSLLFHPNNSSDEHAYTPEIFNSFQFLGVLDLEGLWWGVLFPEELVSLSHLRYLAVAGEFTFIPSSIDNLSYLETLYVRSHDSVIVLPNNIFNMKRLRHLDIPIGATISWDDYNLEKSSLQNLVTFSLLLISGREDAEMLLKMFLKVRRLRFQFYNQFTAVDFLDNLESLNVHRVGRAPKPYLFKLPSNLRELTLSNLRLPWEEMSTVAKLPYLETLKLLSRSLEGQLWDLRADEFLKLRFLKLEGLDVRMWNVQNGCFPCLRRLVVKDCHKLEEIPDYFGEIPTLNIIELHECSFSAAVSARKIVQELQEMGNDEFRIIITPDTEEEHSASSHADAELAKAIVQVQQQPLGTLPVTTAPENAEEHTASHMLNLNKGVDVLPGKQDEGKKKIKGTVVLMKKNVLDFNDFASVLDRVDEFLGKRVSLRLISSANGNPERGLKGKLGSPAYLENWITTITSLTAGESAFDVTFDWDEEIGVPGAFIIRNFHQNEFYLRTVTLEGVPGHERIHFVCNSWVYSTEKYKTDRIFFTNQAYLPNDTPEPLRKYREEELLTLRGDGTGRLEEWDRVYDYAFYNDLGDPDKGSNYARPVLGGSSEYPYPRRGRTGRPPTKTDPNSESRLPLLLSLNIYVPRDERFGHLKMLDFLACGLKSIAQFLLPEFESLFDRTPNEFDTFEDILKLYEGGIKLPDGPSLKNITESIPFEFLKQVLPTDGEGLLKYPMPKIIEDDKTAWRTDEEFAREMLAGVNPMIISGLQEFPPASKLDANVYGNQTSTITREQIEGKLNGLTVDEAIKAHRLFILNHHDTIMPYLRRINSTSTKTYTSRTILFLQDDGTLKPLAIELSLPNPDGDQFGAISQVYMPAEQGVQNSLWQLAKAYVAVNDSGIHQLITHWLRTHAVIEPFVIATNRQLSVLHPIYKLLHPHFRDTMNINAFARQILINAGSVFEATLFPSKFAMEMSAVVYKDWVFPDQALPRDLITRKVAAEDSNSPYGIRLLIQDYPFAVDGLKIWSAIKTWVEDYCSFYYKTDEMIQNDTELQSWWKELREKGHEDKKDEPWWPTMQTRVELIESCTIIIWVSSALHASTNFGQWPYAGYLPNRPTTSRRFMPELGTPEYDELQTNPDKIFLKTITAQRQTLLGLSIIEILSRHSSDEVYLGQRDTAEWTKDSEPLKAFQRFGNKLAEIEEQILQMNDDKKWKNRVGPVNIPYTLLFPTSGVGITGKGIPNSIAI